MFLNRLLYFAVPQVIVGALPNNIQNGQIEDAVPVMANYNWIVNQVNANAAALVNTPQLNTANTFLQLNSGISATGPFNFPIASDVQNNKFEVLSTVAGTNTITAVDSIGVAAYVKGQRWQITIVNTTIAGSVTLNINAIAARPVRKFTSGDIVELTTGDLVASHTYELVDDGTELIVINIRANSQSTNIASAATVNLDNASGDYVAISGAVTITAITLAQGERREVVFQASLILTNGASLLLPGSANITTTAGDVAVFRGEASGVVRCVNYSFANGDTVKPGTLVAFAGTSAPAGYLQCPLSASTINRTTYNRLFAAIGTTWGAGDGSTTFGIPWFTEGYAPVHTNSNVAVLTNGALLAHTHGCGLAQSVFQNGSANIGVPQANAAILTTSTGGTDNLAAGNKVMWCVKY